MTLATFRAAVVAGAATAIPRVTAYEADQINPPMAELAITSGTYANDFDGSIVYQAVLRIYGGRTASVSTQKLLDTYIDPDAATAIKTALEAPSVRIAGGAQYITVDGFTGATSLSVGDITYIVIEFNLTFVI